MEPQGEPNHLQLHSKDVSLHPQVSVPLTLPKKLVNAVDGDHYSQPQNVKLKVPTN